MYLGQDLMLVLAIKTFEPKYSRYSTCLPTIIRLVVWVTQVNRLQLRVMVVHWQVISKDVATSPLAFTLTNSKQTRWTSLQ
jgi:hypothetical protein